MSLQWGHGEIAVGNVIVGRRVLGGHLASMGPRRDRRGEPRRRGPRGGRWPGFNGATARSPWGTEMGRIAPPSRAGFNGATARSPWGTWTYSRSAISSY